MTLKEAPVTGGECKLFYSTGTHATPVWVEVTRAIDVDWSVDLDEADQSSRSSRFKKSNTSLVGLEFSWSYRKKQGTDTVFDFLQAAVLAGTAVEIWAADGASAETGIQGPRAFVKFFTMGGSQALANSEEVEFTAKPTYYEESDAEVDPDWYEVSA